MTSPSAGPQPAAAPAADASVPAGGESAAGGAGDAAATEPVPPEQSREDTDAAWGEYRERDDDRLYRDRPPHWDDF
jgi:hypothetical protein